MAMVAAALLEPYEKEAKEEQGKRTDLEPNIRANLPQSKSAPKATDKAAKDFGISGRSVRDAKVVTKNYTKKIRDV